MPRVHRLAAEPPLAPSSRRHRQPVQRPETAPRPWVYEQTSLATVTLRAFANPHPDARPRFSKHPVRYQLRCDHTPTETRDVLNTVVNADLRRLEEVPL